MKFYREHFGKKLKTAILKSGMTQAKLAEKIQTEPATISRWVNGIDFPSDKFIPKICSTLELDMDYFGFGGLSSSDLIEFLFKNRDLMSSVVKIPPEVLNLLGKQDALYFKSLQRTLELIESKKLSEKRKEETI